MVKIWCNSVLCILWDRKPTDGRDSIRWCREHTFTYMVGGVGAPSEEGAHYMGGNQLNWAT